MKIQAREIFRFAKRNGVRLERGSYRTCAVGMLGKMVGIDVRFAGKQEVADKLGISRADLGDLEMAFEGYNYYYSSRYGKVGKNLARLAGYHTD